MMEHRFADTVHRLNLALTLLQCFLKSRHLFQSCLQVGRALL
jgi:hypothetical protein